MEKLPHYYFFCVVSFQKQTNAKIWSIAFYVAETWTLRKIDRKYLEGFEVWSWRRLEKISWTDRAKNAEVLHGVKEERNILCTIKIRKANLTGRILRRNCLLKHVIEGK
jgi:hypothetical protein